MEFQQIKEFIQSYLEGKGGGDVYDVVNGYLRGISEEKERMAQETKALLSLLQVGVSQPLTQEEAICLGNAGTIAMQTHYAYPLLATVLGYWVEAECSIAMAKGLGEEEKKHVRADIEIQIKDFDVYGYEVSEGRNNYLLDRLFVPPTSSPPSSPEETGFVGKIKSFFQLFRR